MEATRHEYWLPTYGIDYPTVVRGKNTVISSKLFRPVEYQSTQRLLDDVRAELSRGVGKRSSQHEQDEISQPIVEMKAVIQNKALWKSFMRIGNEMIVTKPGRCLFPTLLVSLRGLEHRKVYTVSLRMVPMDNYRYKYSNTAWIPAGESDAIQNPERQTLQHPCSPTSGMFWMKRPISFKAIKITHYGNSKNGNILLHTMHKYVMEVIVTPQDGSQPTSLLLPETTFIAVSAYQNSEVIKLKIDHNPFAKAFKYQDKTAIMEHFSEASSPKEISPKQPVSKPKPVPYLPQMPKTKNASCSSAITSPALSTPPLLPGISPISPGQQVTSLPNFMPTIKSLPSGPFPFVPLLPSQMHASFVPLACPLVSPYLLLMLCNQLYNTRQAHISGKTNSVEVDETSDVMKE